MAVNSINRLVKNTFQQSLFHHPHHKQVVWDLCADKILAFFTVADLEGFSWVPWNPSFEGLPSKILCANVLCTLRPHWNNAEATLISPRLTQITTWLAASASQTRITPLILRASNTTTRM